MAMSDFQNALDNLEAAMEKVGEAAESMSPACDHEDMIDTLNAQLADAQARINSLTAELAGSQDAVLNWNRVKSMASMLSPASVPEASVPEAEHLEETVEDPQ